MNSKELKFDLQSLANSIQPMLENDEGNKCVIPAYLLEIIKTNTPKLYHARKSVFHKDLGISTTNDVLSKLKYDIEKNGLLAVIQKMNSKYLYVIDYTEPDDFSFLTYRKLFITINQYLNQ